MSKIETLKPVFVDYIPSEIEHGKLYVSMIYSTTVHLCASGCGEKVVLPLHPEQWRLTYDGEGVSMSPSVGNWGLACESHYWIRSNRIEWAGRWDAAKVDGGRFRDGRDLDTFYDSDDHPGRVEEPGIRRGLFRRIFRRRS